MAKTKSKEDTKAGRKKDMSSSIGNTREKVALTATPPANAETTKDTTDDEKLPRRIPFRFLDLPSEIRLRIYEEVLCVSTPMDLDPMNYRLILPRLSIFLLNRQVHEEAYRVFYGQALSLFPTHGRFFHSKKPLLQRLSPRYRQAINTLDLRLGPGWSSPPRGQKITPELGLSDCQSVRRLRIFVECDPSEPIFAGFRGKHATEETYQEFCLDLQAGIFEHLPSLTTVEIDAYPAVRKDAPLIVALERQAVQYGKTIVWGVLRGWKDGSDAPGFIGLEQLMASMNISDKPRLVDVLA